MKGVIYIQNIFLKRFWCNQKKKTNFSLRSRGQKKSMFIYKGAKSFMLLLQPWTHLCQNMTHIHKDLVNVCSVLI